MSKFQRHKINYTINLIPRNGFIVKAVDIPNSPYHCRERFSLKNVKVPVVPDISNNYPSSSSFFSDGGQNSRHLFIDSHGRQCQSRQCQSQCTRYSTSHKYLSLKGKPVKELIRCIPQDLNTSPQSLVNNILQGI